MSRALGLALASKYYRASDVLSVSTSFSSSGNEVSFCTIGDASTSEGIFWETLNAAAVTQVPLAVSVWDDGYGISVPKELQTVKSSISEALSGFEASKKQKGIRIYKAKAWDYAELISTYREGIKKCREDHIPVLFHIEEVTQPQGHSTSGSHERYKSAKRMKWELEFDCNKKMADWLIEKNIATQDLIDELDKRSKSYVREQKNIAWNNYLQPVLEKREQLINILERMDANDKSALLRSMKEPSVYELVELARSVVIEYGDQHSDLNEWIQVQYQEAEKNYHTDIYSSTRFAAIRVPEIKARYSEDSAELNGYQILNAFFDKKLEQDARILAFGEDVGKIGDVNQGFAGLQDKYGMDRVFDCGIREWSIIGQAIGSSMRGLRPIAEIQYLDYIVYAMSPLMDDLATVRYRSAGQQAAPAIIRTRGHRLEGIWHSGSPIGFLLHSLRGICICVPRNMTQAAGMYNTLLKSDDPGLIIECLNGYRLKEKLPDNIGEFTVPIGKVEILEPGNDLTLVSYGSCIRIAQQAIKTLKSFGVSIELIDVQTLFPFDLENDIAKSLQKTNKLLILDEDVPGAASAFILQQVLEVQHAFKYLDAAPRTLTAKNNRPPYGSNGDYFTKPNAEDVVLSVLDMIREYEPDRF